MSGDASIGNSELTSIEANGNAIAFSTNGRESDGRAAMCIRGRRGRRQQNDRHLQTRFGDNQFSAVRVEP
jgi:hypothetical protein